MKIFTQGARFFGGQIDRIDEALVKLGHELIANPSDADLVYVNNPWFDDLLRLKDEGKIRGKMIFNVLDMAPHLGDQFPLEKLKHQLTYADAVTCISHTVQKDIQARAGYSPEVVYNPIKPVTRTREQRYLYRAMFVGRVNDAEKRSLIGAQALAIRAMMGGQVITVGGEQPIYGGHFAGAVNDVTLNALYNSVDFLICPTRNAFLGLPILEAMAAGAIPVICKDLDIREEFLPSSIFPEYLDVEPAPWSIAAFIAKFQHDTDAMLEFKERIYNHFTKSVRDKVSPEAVANRILDVYQNLK
jgi:glycosyltransferase involved in cell wall biosynthesis